MTQEQIHELETKLWDAADQLLGKLTNDNIILPKQVLMLLQKRQKEKHVIISCRSKPVLRCYW
jgi:hypothetical protein